MSALTWGPKWQANLIEVTEPSIILSVAWRWLGEKTVHVKALCDFPGYSKNKNSDAALVTELHSLFEAADLIVGFNSRRFDDRISNSRFLVHGLSVPAPYKTFDLLQVARRVFRFPSNKLDDLSAELGLKRKLHTNFDLWKGCLAGDVKSWKQMKRYNAADVEITTELYLKVRGWGNHPPLYTRVMTCPTCQSPHVQLRGFSELKTGRRQRVHCESCGAWSTCGSIIRCG